MLTRLKKKFAKIPIVLLAIIALRGFSNELYSQTQVLDPIKTVNTATGEMSFALPLGTVNGTGGLDFPINLTYQAGIRTTQNASPVGLGFDVSGGSIVRKKVFVADNCVAENYSTKDLSQPCDADTWVVVVKWVAAAVGIIITIICSYISLGSMTAPLSAGMLALLDVLALVSAGVTATSYIVNGVIAGPADYKGGGTHNPVYATNDGKGKGYLNGGSSTDLPDIYFISTPFISGQFMHADSRFRFIPLPGVNSGNVQINFDKNTNVFSVILADGKKLLFEKYDMVDEQYQVYGNTRAGNYDCHYGSQTDDKNVITQWHLTKVLSPDFTGDGGNPLKSDAGSWIKLEYESPVSENMNIFVNNPKFQFSPREAGFADVQLKSLCFLKKITTPNESAEFNYNYDRLDNSATCLAMQCITPQDIGNRQYFRTVLMPRLNTIEIKNERSISKNEIVFSTDYFLRPNTFGSRSSVSSMPIGVAACKGLYEFPSPCGGGMTASPVSDSRYYVYNNGGLLLKEVTTDPITPNPNNASLTLRSVQIKSSDKVLPPIRFRYSGSSNPGLIISSSETRDGSDSQKEQFINKEEDSWGFYCPSYISGSFNDNTTLIRSNGSAYADAWSLNEILFPEGKGIKWTYEPQRYDSANGIAVKNNSSNQPVSKVGGGIRVRSVEVTNNVSNSSSDKYDFIYTNEIGNFVETPLNSSGHATGEPFPYTVVANANEDPRNIVTRGGLYTATKVAYQTVQIVKNLNTQSNTSPNGYTVVETYTSKDFPNAGTYGDIDNSWQRGFLKRLRNFNSKGEIIDDYQPEYRWKKEFTNGWKLRVADGTNGWYNFGTVEKIKEKNFNLGLTKEREVYYSTDVNPNNTQPQNDPDIRSTDTISYRGCRIPLTTERNEEINFTKTKIFSNPDIDDLVIASIRDYSGHHDLNVAIAQDVDYRNVPVENVTSIRTIYEGPATNLLGVEMFDWDQNGQQDIIVLYANINTSAKFYAIVINNPQISGNSLTGATSTFEFDPDMSYSSVCATIADIDNNNKPDIICGVINSSSSNLSLACFLNANEANPQTRRYRGAYIENASTVRHMKTVGKDDLLLTYQDDSEYYIRGDLYADLRISEGLKFYYKPSLGPAIYSPIPKSRNLEYIVIPYIEHSKENSSGPGWLFGGVENEDFTMLAMGTGGFVAAKLKKGQCLSDFDNIPNQVAEKRKDGSFIVSVNLPAFLQYSTMKEKNMVVQSYSNTLYKLPINTQLPIQPASWNSNIVSSSITKYNTTKFLPITNYKWLANIDPITNLSTKQFQQFNLNEGAQNPDWQRLDSVCEFSRLSYPIENAHLSSGKNVFSSIIYGYNGKKAIAGISNGKYDQCAIFTADYDDGIDPEYFDKENGWAKAGSILSWAFPHYGDKSIHVYNTYGPTKNVVFDLNVDHIFSANILHVASGDAMSKTRYVKMAVEFHSGEFNGDETRIGSWDRDIFDLKDGWNFYEHTIKKDELQNHMYSGKNAVDIKYARIWIGNVPRSNTSDPEIADIYLEEIRFYPSAAHVTTTYYDEALGLPILSVDANCKPGVKTYYDGFGRQIRLAKIDPSKTNKVFTTIKETKYHYRNELEPNENIKVLYPEGDEIFHTGDRIEISWVQRNSGHITIVSSNSDGTNPVTVLARTTESMSAGQHEINWNIPDIAGGLNKKITVTHDIDGSASTERTFTIKTPPEIPTYSFPGVNNYDQMPSSGATLSWNCSDRDGDALEYSVYLAEGTIAYALPQKTSQKTINLGNLIYGREYRFKISVTDGRNTVEGPEWKFRTFEGKRRLIIKAQEIVQGGSMSSANCALNGTNCPNCYDCPEIEERVINNDFGSQYFVPGEFITSVHPTATTSPLHCGLSNSSSGYPTGYQKSIVNWELADGTEGRITVPDGPIITFQMPDNDLVLKAVYGTCQLETGNPPPNTPPFMPGNVAPENNVTNVPIIGTSLTWTGGDLNTGDVDYQIYIARPGQSLTYERTITSSAAAGQQISFPLGTLLYNSTYSWRIVADDKVNPPVESPVWSFTTTNDNGLYRVLVTAEKLTSQSGGNGCNSSCMSACSKIEVDELINQDYAPNTTLTVSAIASMQCGVCGFGSGTTSLFSRFSSWIITPSDAITTNDALTDPEFTFTTGGKAVTIRAQYSNPCGNTVIK